MMSEEREPILVPLHLPFAWWNTGVSPPLPPGHPLSPKRQQAQEAHRQQARKVIEELVIEHGCALLALAETIGEKPIAWIPDSVRQNWKAIENPGGAERPRVDVLFDARRLALRCHDWLVQGGRGLLAEFTLPPAGDSDPESLLLAAVHWSSGLYNGRRAQDEHATDEKALRSRITRRIKEGRQQPHVLVAGDLNVEPFDRDGLEGLGASRSRATVRRAAADAEKDPLFYNAAWRWLGERYAWHPARQVPSLAGTYRKGDDRHGGWYTFDQLLVSGSLLREHGWTLMEEGLGPFPSAHVFNSSRSKFVRPFDHLPILGHLEWHGNDEEGRR